MTHVLTHLPPVGSASACSPGEVAYRAGLLRAGSQVASGSEVRTVRAHLRTLAEYGLAAVDEVGRWRASAAATAPAAVRRRTLETVGRAMTSRKVAAVTLERSGFRAVVDVEERRRAWARTRDAALARAAKAQRGRQMGWWDGLSAVQQDQRRTVCSGRFAVLSPAEQAGRKQLLAASRARAGVVESERYETWLKETPAAALEQRSIEHAFAYAARPAHEQIQLVAGWAEHRARWRLPHHTRGPGAERPPLPEEFLLHRTMPDLEELALFDADTTQRAARRAG